MSEMVERLCDVLFANVPVDEWDIGAQRQTVRAVLAAMREPTEGMLDAGAEHAGFMVDPDTAKKTALAVWGDMIDAALKE